MHTTENAVVVQKTIENVLLSIFLSFFSYDCRIISSNVHVLSLGDIFFLFENLIFKLNCSTIRLIFAVSVFRILQKQPI